MTRPGRLTTSPVSTSASPLDTLDVARSLVERALKAGADAADAIVVEGTSVGASWRMGKLEDVERSEGRDAGLRVLVGRRQAIVSSTDLSERSLGPLIERAVAMAKAAPEDPYCGLAPTADLAASWPELDLADRAIGLDTDALAERAAEAEEAALAVAGVTNSEGASAGWSRSGVALATSGGFAGSYEGTSHSISCSVIAGEGTGMETDYDYSSRRFFADLEAPAAIGRSAAERAVRRLKPRKMKSQAVPVVYDPRVSAGLIGHLAGAINGAAIARGTSFLKNAMDQRILPAGLDVIDDPLRPRGLRSKPFDGEGLATAPRMLVEDGYLRSWVLDSTTARQLGLKSTGNAARGTGSPPSPSTTNLYLGAGTVSVKDLIADIKQGLYITQLIGMGVNGITGDYSRGAAGFWIENGEIAFPVSEITVAGNLRDMFLHLTPADDLEFRHGTDAPTLRIEGMMVAGT